ncbi:MAG: nuclear transport factor 2 family protein [Thermoleophilaceae bacterium]
MTGDQAASAPEEVVEAIYRAWAEGRSARDWIAEDVEYVNPDDAIEPGVKRGREYFRKVRDVYDDFAVAPERMVRVGDEDVVVIARLTGRASGSGVGLDARQGYIWTVRGGQVVRFRWFREPEQALRAAGLDPD